MLRGANAVSIAYWIVAGLLAVTYLYGGVSKIIRTQDDLRPVMAWVGRIPMRLVRTIGILEVLGATGLIVPPLTGIAPVLAVAAAVGLALLQVGGIAVHLTSTDDRQIVLNLALLILAVTAAALARAGL